MAVTERTTRVRTDGPRTTTGTDRGRSGASGPEQILQLQRSAGNRAVTAMLSGSGGPLPVQRLFGRAKKPEPPKAPPLSPFLAQQVQNKIVTDPRMIEAERLRGQGRDDDAIAGIESFWNGYVLVKTETGHDRLIKLADFKPLMFTPSERAMLKNRRWQAASAVLQMWKTAVARGEVRDPNPPAEKEKDYSKSVDTVTGIVDSVGGVNTTADYGARIGDKVELHQAASKLPPAPSPGIGGDIKEEWASLTDTHSISDSTDATYEARHFKNPAEWADGMIGIIGQAIGLVSSVTKTISLALDKKATKADVAAQVQDNLSQAATTANGILQAIERAQGSELTTNMFHWVPGLSIFSNGFAALGSAVSLVQKAYRVYKINQARDSDAVKSRDKEDIKLAVKRLWVRAAQQVEQDAFSTAKSLTNAGLAVAEVASAGGFGIPRLASTVVSGAGAVHSLGHMIADSVRAAKSKSALSNYFGAKLGGSAEKLIRTDPATAARTIITRAGEGDQTSLDVLDAYSIKVPGINGPRLQQARERDETYTTGSGRTQKERMFSYSAADTETYDAAVAKLMFGLKENEKPQTVWDKVKSGVSKGLKAMPDMRDRWRQATRVRDLRNEQNWGGVKDRGGWWSFKQTVFAGESGVQKLADSTARAINEGFARDKAGGQDAPDAKAVHNVSTDEIRRQLLERVSPEAILRAKRRDARRDAAQPRLDIDFKPELQPTWSQAKGMSFGSLSDLIHAGKAASGLTDAEWQVMVIVFTERFKEASVAVTGTGA